MSRNQRLAMLAIAVVIVAVAIVVVPGGDDDGPTPAAQTAAETETVEVTGSTTATGAETATAETQPKPKPKPPLLTAAKPRELEYKKGDTITFRVRHSADEEIHVHGYDKSKDVKANETVTMTFKANIEGIFEIELEHSGTPLGTLKVEPR